LGNSPAKAGDDARGAGQAGNVIGFWSSSAVCLNGLVFLGTSEPETNGNHGFLP